MVPPLDQPPPYPGWWDRPGLVAVYPPPPSRFPSVEADSIGGRIPPFVLPFPITPFFFPPKCFRKYIKPRALLLRFSSSSSPVVDADVFYLPPNRRNGSSPSEPLSPSLAFPSPCRPVAPFLESPFVAKFAFSPGPPRWLGRSHPRKSLFSGTRVGED